MAISADEPEKEKSPDEEKITQERALEYEHIYQLAGTVFKTPWGACYARYGEENFSGDGASLFTLVEFNNGDVGLAKLGWGEFSARTFQSGEYPYFKDCPFDLLVVDQVAGHFHMRDILSRLDYDWIEYLRQYSTLVAREGVVTSGPIYFDRGMVEKKLDYPIVPIKYDEMMRDMRNLAISSGNMVPGKPIDEFRISPRSFSDFLLSLPKDDRELLKLFHEDRFYKSGYLTPGQIGSRNYDQTGIERHIRSYYISMIYGMGIEEKDIPNLISKFDHEKLEFTA